MNPDNPRPAITPLYDEAAIRDRLQIMAADMARDLPKNILMVALLKGSFMFAADLVREMHRQGFAPQLDFMGLSSYGAATVSSRTVTVTQEMSEEVAGKDVLIVDDILESGRTLNFARNLLLSRGARSVRLAVLLEKPGKLAVTIKADYVGFAIPDRFVIGYGLDYANDYRELPYIGVLQQN